MNEHENLYPEANYAGDNINTHRANEHGTTSEMSAVSACRACLAVDVKLGSVTSSYTQEVYHHLTGIPTADGRPALFCAVCHARMERCQDFRDQCLRADGVLRQILSRGVGLTKSSISLIDRDSYKLTSKYTISQLEVLYIPAEDAKTENKYEQPNISLNEELMKSEPDLEQHNDEDNDNGEMDNDNMELDNYNDDMELDNEFSDSEDDLPLKRISEKNKKEKKNTKRTKAFTADYAREVWLTPAQQLADMRARTQSRNYRDAPLRCEPCARGFVDQRAHERHSTRHLPSAGEHACPLCALRYPSARQLRAHAASVHARRYVCARCPHRSHTAHHARAHEKWHRGFEYDCKLCGMKFRKPTSLYSHARVVHATQFVCCTCGESFVGRHGLLMHRSKSHARDTQLTEESEPIAKRHCAVCEITFDTEHAWSRHMMTAVKHTQDKDSLTCRVCMCAFVTPTERTRHERTHTTARAKHVNREATHACECCPSKFASPSRLRAHRARVHLGQKALSKRMVCEVCGKECTSAATLRYHQRTHTGERPYPCGACGKRFADSNQLRIHTRTHTDARPYCCGRCGKAFRQRPALTRHERVHTGAKPYSCQYCAKAFSQSNSLKLHVRTVHLKLPPNRRNKAQNATKQTQDAGKLYEVQNTTV